MPEIALPEAPTSSYEHPAHTKSITAKNIVVHVDIIA
jgi:hypothetical protein